MVKRLEHAQECSGDEEDCELTTEEIYSGIDLFYSEGDEATEEERESYHDEDEARQALDEDPLSVEVRSDWHTPGGDSEETEYTILLCTGGPAVRIIGDLGPHNEPDSAKIEYQDWFTPWVEYTDSTTDEDNALLTYARHFYFGE